MTKGEEGGSHKHIVKNINSLFCRIYYSIWSNQFQTNCGKCPLLFYEGFLYAYKVCKNNNDIRFDPQKVIGIIREFQGSFKDVLRKFQGCFKKILRVFQKCSNEVCFLISLLHGSHRSYPSRRRACSTFWGIFYLGLSPYTGNL